MDEEYNKQKWDSKNDYSYADLVSFEDDNDAAAITDKITLYADGKLVWGTEPDGTTATDVKEEPTPVKADWGDANVDKKVDLNDAVAILQYVALPTKYPLTSQGELNADVIDNGTSGVTGMDALAIQMFDAKLFTSAAWPMSKAKMESYRK